MKLSIILAIDENNLIGDSNSKNGLAWHYKEDLQFYKKTTSNKKNVMGRKTYQAIGKALPNRETIVLSQDKDFKLLDAQVISNYKNIFNFVDEEIMIVGGIQIFNLYFPFIDRIYITRIHKMHQGNIYYNELDLKNFILKKSNYSEDKVLEFQVWERNENFKTRNY